MLKKNEWTFWVEVSEMPDDGVFAMQITDDVLDRDCFPVWCVVIAAGIVVQQHDMYRSDMYDRPNMMGWTKNKVAKWCQYEPGDNHPQQSRDILWMKP